MRHWVVALCSGLLLLVVAPAEGQRSESWGEPHALALQVLDEEIAIAGMLDRLRTPVPELTILRNVQVTDPVERTRVAGQSIIVENGRIAWMGNAAEEPQVQGATVIDGGGRFAAPGLTDMHIHTESASSWLLNLANGVTTVREMGGFPWMLAARDAVGADRMLAPTAYVAGPLFNAGTLEGYAVNPQDAITARRLVRQQAACGYDFIKVHNVVPHRLFDAIAGEAASVGMDLIGHVPHGMPVRYAVEHGMRTMEHLKGFLNDRTLQMGDTDYPAAGLPNVWVTPTLTANLAFEPPGAIPALLNAPEARYVPERRRRSWAEQTAAAENDRLRVGREGQLRRRELIRTLIPQHARFLAGTDGDGYPFAVMGFVLLRELRMLREAGVPAEEVFRSATSAPAEAMRAEGDFGRLRRGGRADIVLLDRDPLEDPNAYEHRTGVMVRGRWLPQATLGAALEELARLYARPAVANRPNRSQTDALVQRARQAVADGFVFNARILAEAAAALRHAGRTEAAEQLAALAVAPTTGPCFAIRW
jgi:imidazolonepropionase-like amidohydrolase